MKVFFGVRETQGRFRFTLGSFLILALLSCVTGVSPTATTISEIIVETPLSRLGPPTEGTLKIILQRLDVEYLGQDGHKVIGSGCPGNDSQGSVENYHFIVSGVEEFRTVRRVVVLGDNSTLTWAWPCSDTWGLVAENYGKGVWDIFIAPSSPTEIYTVLFFYDDNTVAVGMTVSR